MVEFTPEQFNDEVERRVVEGIRVGKNPWCCSDYVENEAYRRLNHQSSPMESYPQETFWESQERWCMEGVITEERLREIKDQDRYFNRLAKMERET